MEPNRTSQDLALIDAICPETYPANLELHLIGQRWSEPHRSIWI